MGRGLGRLFLPLQSKEAGMAAGWRSCWWMKQLQPRAVQVPIAAHRLWGCENGLAMRAASGPGGSVRGCCILRLFLLPPPPSFSIMHLSLAVSPCVFCAAFLTIP